MAFPIIVPKLKVYKGDTFSASFVLKQGTPSEVIDLVDEGWTNWIAQWRSNPSSSTAVNFAVDTSQASVGRITVSLSATQANTLTNGYWDLQSSRGSEVKTWLRGEVDVMKDVTRAS